MDAQWENIFNPDVLRNRLITAGLYLLAHEMLIASIKEPIFDFFSNEWCPEKGWKFSLEYKDEVLSLDPKGKKDQLRSSVQWLLKMNVIDESDAKKIEELTNARNLFAHELRTVVADSDMPPFDGLFPMIIQIITKIGRWWAINVDMAVDDRWAHRSVNPEDVMPGTTVILQALEKVALGDEEAAWAYFKAYQASKEL